MSLAAPVVDGKVVQNTTAANTTGAGKETKANNSMDKDSFLQLLVAQMKYQDPMEPQSNTEYVAQYAQFSELEAMQNLSSNMDLQRATGLVGKEVVVKTTGASGEPVYTQGRVDFVSTEGSKAYMTINGQKYSIDDLDSVMDGEYLNATTLATEFITSLNKLPRAASLTLEYKDVRGDISGRRISASIRNMSRGWTRYLRQQRKPKRRRPKRRRIRTEAMRTASRQERRMETVTASR